MKRSTIVVAIVAAIAAIAGSSYLYLAPKEPEIRKSARVAYQERQWNRAFNEATRRLKEAPDDFHARLIQARSAARIERDSFSLEAYGMLKERPEEAEDLFLVGSILLRQGRTAEAEQLLTRAFETDPAHDEAAGFLPQFLFRNRRFESAAAIARKRLSAIPSDDAARILLARIHDASFEPSAVIETLAGPNGLIRIANRPDLDVQESTLRKLLARNYLRLHEPHKAIESLGELDKSDRESLWLTSRARIQLGDKPRAIEFIEAARNASGEIGSLEEPSPFAGATSCQECHRDIFDDQQSSRHAMTFRYGNQPGELPWNGFEKTDFHSSSLTVKFSPKPGTMEMAFVNGTDEIRTLITYIIGSGRHAITPLIDPRDGTEQRESRWTWYAAVNDWDLTPGQRRNPESALDLMGVAQTPDMLRLCLGCHTTNPSEILAREGKTVADRGIGCERCHGPGGNHIEATRLNLQDKAIGRFRRSSIGTRPQVMQACGECHGTAGRDLGAASDPTVVRFQSMTLTFSECYKQGQTMQNGFDCLTCHSPHHDAETDARHYVSKCLECHSVATKENEILAALCKVEPAGDCVSCHMPKVPSVQPHTRFTDHQIRIPKQ
jgi:tetratricopeptide (TPR) repeat protein